MTPTEFVEEYSDGMLTRDELFAALTELLSQTPSALVDVDTAVDVELGLQDAWERWLVALLGSPHILLGDHLVTVSDKLRSTIAAAEAHKFKARLSFADAVRATDVVDVKVERAYSGSVVLPESVFSFVESAIGD